MRAAKATGVDPYNSHWARRRDYNDAQLVPSAEFARGEGVSVRFSDFMPLEEDRLWTPKVVIPFREVVDRLGTFRPVVRLTPNAASETAVRFTFDDGLGEIGVIAPVSQAFCGQCSRVRLTSDGKIRTCLFSQSDHDLYGVMNSGGSDKDPAAFIPRTVMKKEARHHIGEPGFLKPSRSMVHIGGWRRFHFFEKKKAAPPAPPMPVGKRV